MTVFPRLVLVILLVAWLLAVVEVARSSPPASIDRALHAASARYGVPYRELRTVSGCESGWQADPPHNNSSRGLFQFQPSTWAHTPYARRSILDPWASAMAAAWLVRHDGGWREWVCKP